ncbi:MAG TPA: DUF892 family protein [Abditibacteriaceae bacterium]|jgi:ferritin-like metal-binding protein YciE
MPETMTIDTLSDLMVVELQELYSTEQQSLEAMPMMAQFATSPQLKQALEEHVTQTQGQVQRLEQIASQLGASLDGPPTRIVEALIAEGLEKLQSIAEPSVRDALILAAQQKLEHIEISCYGTARSHALQLNQPEAADLLQDTLQEEKQNDERLTHLAENLVNDQADPMHSQGS